ncbi:MAG: LytTR family DNA-binding domain-containing protein [Hespellia sp.]|nr:LytTR family DNA-binding domain-containing protein [Hespellia sp.]
MKIQIAICDEIKKDREILYNELNVYFTMKHLGTQIKEYTSGEDLLEDYEKEKFNLIFLDIFLKDTTGMEVAHQLRKAGFHGNFVFLTVSPDYALESYEVRASGYLLKPLKEEKLISLLDDLYEEWSSERYYFYRKNSIWRWIKHRDIVFAESQNHTVRFHMEDGEILTEPGKLSDVEKILDNECFLRCHQSYLVNMQHIVGVSTDFQMDTGEHVLLRKRERKAIRERYCQWAVKNRL